MLLSATSQPENVYPKLPFELLEMGAFYVLPHDLVALFKASEPSNWLQMMLRPYMAQQVADRPWWTCLRVNFMYTDEERRARPPQAVTTKSEGRADRFTSMMVRNLSDPNLGLYPTRLCLAPHGEELESDRASDCMRILARHSEYSSLETVRQYLVQEEYDAEHYGLPFRNRWLRSN